MMAKFCIVVNSHNSCLVKALNLTYYFTNSCSKHVYKWEHCGWDLWFEHIFSQFVGTEERSS